MKTICWGRVVQGGDSAEIQGFLLARVVQATALQVRCLGHSVVAVSGQRGSEGSPPSRTGMQLAGWFRIEVTPPRVGLQIHSINHQQLQLQNP